MIDFCSNPVLRFRFICNKYQCLLTICFIFGNILLSVKPKGILLWFFPIHFGASNVFRSISDSLWNCLSDFFLVETLNLRFINDSFQICRFFGILKFDRLLTICMILSVIEDEQRYNVKNSPSGGLLQTVVNNLFCSLFWYIVVSKNLMLLLEHLKSNLFYRTTIIKFNKL